MYIYIHKAAGQSTGSTTAKGKLVYKRGKGRSKGGKEMLNTIHFIVYSPIYKYISLF